MTRNCHARSRQNRQRAQTKSRATRRQTVKVVRPNGGRKKPSHVWRRAVQGEPDVTTGLAEVAPPKDTLVALLIPQAGWPFN